MRSRPNSVKQNGTFKRSRMFSFIWKGKIGSFAKKEGIWSICHFGVIGTMRYSISKCTFLFNKPGGLASLSRIKPGSKNLIPAYLRDKKLFFKTKTFKRRDSTPIFSKAGIVSFWDKTKSKQNLPKEEIVLQNWHYPFFIVKWKIKTLAVSLIRRDKINLSLILSL